MPKDRVRANTPALPRRSFLAGAVASPLAALPSQVAASQDSDLAELDDIITIARNTGHSIDSVATWFEDVPGSIVKRIAQNTFETPFDAVRMIGHHADKIAGLLRETTPKGYKKPTSYATAGQRLMACAFPPNWEHGQEYMNFDRERGWVMAT